MEIQLSQALIRSFHTGDAESITHYANNRNVSRNLTDMFPFPYQLSDAETFIDKVISTDPEQVFALVIDGEAVGGIGVHPKDGCYRSTALLGYWLGEPFWGRGIMTEAVRAITAWAIPRFDLLRVEAGVFAWNTASARVLEKARYVLEGRHRKSVIKFGEVTDQLMYAYVV